MADNITIKELADELEVSKTTIRNHLKRLPEEFAVTNENGVIILNADVVRFVRESVMLSKLKVSGKATGEVSAKLSIDLPVSQFPTDEQVEFLKKQLDEKDKQLERKDEIIHELTNSIRDQQKLTLLQQQKNDQLLLENSDLKNRKWWQFWK